MANRVFYLIENAEWVFYSGKEVVVQILFQCNLAHNLDVGGSFYMDKRSRDGCDWYREIMVYECVRKGSLGYMGVMESNVCMKLRVFE